MYNSKHYSERRSILLLFSELAIIIIIFNIFSLPLEKCGGKKSKNGLLKFAIKIHFIRKLLYANSYSIPSISKINIHT